MMNFLNFVKQHYTIKPFIYKTIKKRKLSFLPEAKQVIPTASDKYQQSIVAKSSDNAPKTRSALSFRYVFIIALFLISTNIFSQTYRLVNIFSDRIPDTYLSHWEPVDHYSAAPDTFSLWGYQLYYDDLENGSYEVEYYKGSAKGMYKFLTNVVNFAAKYRNEDQAMTFISGVKIKTTRMLSFRYILIYDRENKVFRKFSERQLKEMLIRFVSRCNNMNIKYQ